MDKSAEVLALLSAHDIPYTLHSHAPMANIAQCQDIQGVDWLQAAMPKNVFLCNRQQTQHYLLLLPHYMSYRTAVVSKLLGVSRLSFAPEEKLPQMLGLSAGAVSPLGLMFDGEKQVQLVMEKRLLSFQRMLFHPCVNHLSVELEVSDFMRVFLPAVHHQAHIISIEES